VARAQTPAPLPPAPIDDAALLTALEDLYAWYREWSTIARVAIRKRSHLIALGLARRTYTASAVDADVDGDDGVVDGTDSPEDDPADA
ncbi:MAG: hypothetical protein KC549_13975, partial [Myxococcales bacterium]|nr:hypothetical protein [Myxococcales bacterium]